MTAAPDADDVHALGVQLDAAVHVTFARFAVVAPAFIVADGLGSCLQLVPLNGPVGSIVLLFVATVLENRARVVAIASARHGDRRRVDWGAALRHPAALAFAVLSMLELGIPYLALGVVSGLAFVLFRIPMVTLSGRPTSFLFLFAAILAVAVGAVLLVALLLVALAGVVATIDTVLDGTAPHRALGRWLRLAFARRSLGPTVFAAAVVVLLFAGVPMLLAVAIPWGPLPVRIAIDAIPEGVADAVAVMFAWRWRDAALNRRAGRDIEQLLDASPG